MADVEPPVLSLHDWEDKWTAGATGWHEATGNETLWKHFSQLLVKHFPTRQAEELKVLVPLCGKTRDMHRFYQMGFIVVGIEFAPQPIREFFEENEICTAPANDTTFTRSADGRMILGQGDLYTFTGNSEVKSGEHMLPFPKYDIIWDRGSFEAINIEDRGKYATHMAGLLAEDGLYLLQAEDYDRSEYSGPPFQVNMDALRESFGARMSIEVIDSYDRLAEESKYRELWTSAGLSWMTGYFYSMRKIHKND